ncbi:hypothetical protein HanRHA438_Chr06g0286861 [Helianthus annuus]|nr:hypothetical protein HanRHA438_Chr06g0286861 [Helianthus annuus]
MLYMAGYLRSLAWFVGGRVEEYSAQKKFCHKVLHLVFGWEKSRGILGCKYGRRSR